MTYCIVFQYFALCLPLNFFKILCVVFPQIFHDVFQYGTVIVSLLPQGALQSSNCAAPPGSLVGHASSGQFLCSLLSDSDHSTRFRPVNKLSAKAEEAAGVLECQAPAEQTEFLQQGRWQCRWSLEVLMASNSRFIMMMIMMMHDHQQGRA